LDLERGKKMTQEEKEKLLQRLIQCGALPLQKEYVNVMMKNEDISSVPEDDIGITASGVKYVKSAVNKYLYENRYPFTEQYIEMVAKLFEVSGDEVQTAQRKAVYHHVLENATDEEIEQYMKVALLEQTAMINMRLKQDAFNFKDYKVEVITDTDSGGTNVVALKDCLEHYSKLGWTLKTIFTNELGKESHREGYDIINATIDQIVLIFERPMFMTDESAEQAREEHHKRNVVQKENITSYFNDQN